MRSYSERLFVPVSWWLLAAPTIAVLGAEVWAYANLAAIWSVAVYAAFVAVVAAFLLNWGRTTVTVADGQLRAGGAALPLEHAGEVAALDEKQATRIRGPRGDPAAHLLLRPYLKRAVYVEVTDPASPSPYWLVATRHPSELAAAIETCRQPSGSVTG
jgi:hypothetical protein